MFGFQRRRHSSQPVSSSNASARRRRQTATRTTRRRLFLEAFEPRNLMAVDFSIVNPQLVRNEDGSSAFTFQIHKTAGNVASVQYSVVGSGTNPASADDFVGGLPTNVTVNFADAGVSDSALITIPVLNDASVEGNEDFTVTLVSPSAGDAIGSPGAAVGTIQDNDTATVTLSSTANVVEGAATSSLLVTLALTTNGTGTAALQTPITGIGLSSDADFTSSVVSFGAGATAGATQILTVTAANDRELEVAESLSSTLSASFVSNASVTLAGTGTVNVTDDESASISIESTSNVTEGGSQTIPVILTISGTGTGGSFRLASGVSITADVTRSGGTATSGSDFQAFGTQTVTYNNSAASGTAKAVTVTTIDDLTLEASETILLTLGNLNASATATVLENTANTTTILDNDVPGNDKFVIAYDPVFFGWQRSTLPITGDGVTEVLPAFPTDNYQDGQVGDFNGDGTTDYLARQADGDWVVGVSNGNSYNVQLWGWFTDALPWATIEVGDVNNDGKDDLVGYLAASGQWWAAVSTGTSFDNHLLTGWSTSVTWQDHLVADFTGDGRVDVAARTNEGHWWLAETSPTATTGTLSDVQFLTAWATHVQWRDVKAADYNGDNLVDIVGRADFTNSDISQWWLARVAPSSGNFVANNVPLTGWVESAGWTTVIADINGDQKQDIVGRTTSGEWWIVREDGSATLSAHLGTWFPFFSNWADTLVGDVDDDGKDDLIGRRDNGEWLLSRFTNGGPPAARAQQDNNPAQWLSANNWVFAGYGELF